MKTKHTFLFQEGLWVSRGYYSDMGENRFPVKGEVRITFPPGKWRSESFLLVLTEPPSEISNHYEISPFEKGRDYTTWKSINPSLGPCVGKLIVFDDTIFSIFTSKDGRYSGSEFMLRLDNKLYWNRGVIFKGDKKLSSWAVEMKSGKDPKKKPRKT